MKTADIKALAAGTELFYCRFNNWNTGHGQDGTRVIVVDATTGHWRRNEDTQAWERRPAANKYGGYTKRTEHGILVKSAKEGGNTYVVPAAHIRGLYDKCQGVLEELRAANASRADFKKNESIRQEEMRRAITEEFGLQVQAGYAGYGVSATSAIINTEDLLNLLRTLRLDAQGWVL